LTFPDSHVKCPSCEAVVPWSPACINCGSRLPPRPHKPPFQAIGESLKDEENRAKAKEELVETATEVKPEEEPEGRLATYMLWRVKLLERLERGEIVGEVFTELYSQYMDKTVELTQQYADIGDQVTEAHEILVDTRRLLEEKQEKRARGELTTKEFMSEFEKLRTIIDKVQTGINKLRLHRNTLGIGGSTEEDAAKLRDIRSRLHDYSVRLPGLAASGVVPAEMRDIVQGDLKQMLGVFESSVDGGLEPEEPEPEHTRVAAAEPKPQETVEEDKQHRELTRYVKGHDDELRRVLRALRLHDHVLILGPDGEGKTETLLRLQRNMGGVYLACSEEVTGRELVAGFNPGAPPAEAVYAGAVARIEEGSEAPILYLDNATKLRPAAQELLYEAMNNKAYTSPVDGSLHVLPQEFCVVAAGTLDAYVQEAPDPAFMDRFGKVIMWGRTPMESIQALLARFALPQHVFDLAVWIRQEASTMRYLAPVSVRNLLKFAKEYHTYRDIYQDEARLRQLAVDRLLRLRVLNRFGLEEYEEARRRVMEYERGQA
jgi:MoxR-like ATPase/soluble cytochrome b562